ncbi:helix-turn-helix domain-containing protein [Nocardia concava]|uniref:helix-turn-helix domain-containing protein n=1 Tax=Nocardia concava TaxID=257281 RepID=UPI000307EDB2|nr:helix-turn-helix domain-containing protein [Nocardia concava]
MTEAPETRGGISLGAYLKRERLRQGMTQRAVADALHMSTSGYEKIENGQRIPHQDTLNALARLFEIPMNRRRVLWSIATGDDLGVSAGASGSVTEGMRVFMRNLRGPACLHQIPEFNILAGNALGVRMFPWLDPRLGSATRPLNIIVATMTDPRAPQIMVNWADFIHRCVFGLQEYALATTPLERVREIREACRSNPEFDRIWNTPCPPEVLADDTALIRDPATGTVSKYQVDCLRWSYPHRDMELFSLTPRDPDPATEDPDTSTIVGW